MKTTTLLDQNGLSLIELMVAMAIGLILMLGATGVLVSNQRSFQVTEDVAAIQENARAAIDMIGRDLREAGLHPCGTATVIDKAGTAASIALAAHWNTPLNLSPAGYPANKLAGTDALSTTLAGATNNITAFVQNSPSVTVEGETTAITVGSPVMVCNPEKGFVYTATAVAGNAVTLSPTPTESLANGVLVARSNTNLWYVGTNGRDDGIGSSLFRFTTGDAAPIEMIDNVAGLTVAADITGATRITLTLCGRRDLQESERSLRAQTCPAARMERTVTTVIQTR